MKGNNHKISLGLFGVDRCLVCGNNDGKNYCYKSYDGDTPKRFLITVAMARGCQSHDDNIMDNGGNKKMLFFRPREKWRIID